MNTLHGIGVALVTPFNEDLSIDFPALEKLIEFNLSHGVDYFVLLGTTGETATLTLEEKQKLVEFIIKVNNNRVPLVLGMGGNNTQEIIEALTLINIEPFEAILSVCPYYNKPNQEGIYQHFKSIATASSKPIILYNVPGRTVVNMAVSTTVRLAQDFKNIVAIKEASPDFVQCLELIKEKPKEFVVLSGDDALANSQILAGASGVISVLAQGFPKEFCQMVKHALGRRPDESYRLYNLLYTMESLIFEEGSPGGIKCVLHELGIIQPYIRLPLVQASKELKEKIKAEIRKIQNANI